MKKVKAIYLRTSTKKQEVQSQLNEIRKYLVGKGISFEECLVYEDRLSGRSMCRPKLNELQNDMLNGKVKQIYFYSLDRLSRQGTESVMSFLALANSKGIQVEFIADQFLNYDDHFIRNILLTVMAELARKERAKIVDRVKAGLEVAKKNGKKLGRPSVENIDEILKLREEGCSLQSIANQLSIGKSTVHKYLVKYSGHKTVHKKIKK